MKTFDITLGDRKFVIEPGRIARQAESSALIRYGDTVVLVTSISGSRDEKIDFLPLLVEYREQSYAAGKIPGGFFKREGRPREREILYGRAIDRAIRPLFPKDFIDDIEVVAFLLSYDMENEGDLLGIIGASTVLSMSSIPFTGPIGAVKVGYIDKKFVINPTNRELEKSDFELLLTGGREQINMIEFSGSPLPEEILTDAIEFALPYMEKIISLEERVVEGFGRTKDKDYRKINIDNALREKVKTLSLDGIKDAFKLNAKKERQEALDKLLEKVLTELIGTYPEMELEIESAFDTTAKEEMRRMIVQDGLRVDGRGLDDIRPISAEVGILPRTHGSSLFTRGETQALVVTTLGTSEDEQRLSEMEPEDTKRFMLHYNFHPFSTGEVKPLRGPARREIGHGALAENALERLIPTEEVFPYTIRVVSDILESNGSTSMATVCGASLSLMDAGVPIASACAGISIGLIKEEGKYQLLTDIIGLEDHYGDMDFKVAGTEKGITAVQLDLKIQGLSLDILRNALDKAKEARGRILEIMNTTLKEPRSEISQYAPKVTAIWVPKEKIGAVIGTGGRTIRNITETTNTKIDIDDATGKIIISGEGGADIERARTMIEELVQDIEIGQIYKGKVVKTTTFGAFVEVLPGKEGLVHISELKNERVKRVEDVVKVGDEILVKVLGIDEMGKIRLSHKRAVNEKKAHP